MIFTGKGKACKKIKYQDMSFYVDPGFVDKFNECSLEITDKELIALTESSDNRSVRLSIKTNVVIKTNTLRSFRRQLYTHFGVQGLFNRYSLVDEYKNLRALSHLDFVPKVYALGVCSSFPVKKECLIIEYYNDALTVDEMVIKYPDQEELILKSILQVFLKAWEGGFAHLDPNPGNILFLSWDKVKLIDLEGCFIRPKDKEFYFGFTMGVFFHYWYSKYIEEKRYSDVVLEFIMESCGGLNMSIFNNYYDFFKFNDVSRKEKYRMYKSARERKKLLKG